MARITVRLVPGVAEAMHRGTEPRADAREITELASGLGARLEPMHPGADDPLLTPYFSLEVADDAAAEKAAEILRKHSAVEAAYVKPPVSPA